MKKTRILASLLCIMMIVCALPVMQASAAVGDLDASVATAMGVKNASVVYERVLTGISYGDIIAHSNSSGTYGKIDYSADGAVFPAADTQAVNGGLLYSTASDVWDEANATVITAKLGTSDDAIIVNMYSNNKSGTSSFEISSTGLTIYNATEAGKNDNAFLEFAFGTEWFEIMLVQKATTFDVYAKKATDTVWISSEDVQGLYYRAASSKKPTPTAAEFTIISTSVSAVTPNIVKSISVYHEDTAIRTIADVLQDGVSQSRATAGDTVAKVKTDDLYATTHDWNFANSTMETYSRSGNGSLTVPEGAEITAEGLDLIGTNGEGEWKYMPHSKWAFVNAGEGTNTLFRAGYVKVKGNVTIKFTGSDHKRVNVVTSVPGSAMTTNEGDATKTHSFTPDNEWVEYIFVERNGNTANIYAKKVTDTAWTYVGYTGTPTKLSADDPGLKFSGTGVVALWKTIEFNENGYSSGYPDAKVVATDSETIPANANALWFAEEFNEMPGYVPAPVFGSASSVENGVLDTKATVENAELGTVYAEGTMNIAGMSIPVGGYAEFKAKGNGAMEATFDDGTNKFYYHRLPADNYTIQGTAVGVLGNYVNDSDMAWRTYRVVRTTEGYSFYSKAEGDTGWKIMGTAAEASKRASDGNGAYVSFRFHTNCDGVSEGSGQLDYLRIYGLAPANPLTLTDGYTTTTIDNGAILSYPASLRAIVTEDTGKLLVVTYKGDDMLKAQIVNVEDMVNKSAIFDARGTDATKIKVFLWDSFSGLNRKTPVVTLNL